ncbi:MAG: hypothetical protein AB2L09_08845 [Coriobacteriia bacterium]
MRHFKADVIIIRPVRLKKWVAVSLAASLAVGALALGGCGSKDAGSTAGGSGTGGSGSGASESTLSGTINISGSDTMVNMARLSRSR